MTLKELRAEALKLPAREREELAQQLLASLGERDALVSSSVDIGVTDAAVVPLEEDPIYNLGKYPVSGGDLDGTSELDARIANVGTVVSGRRNGETPPKEDPLWALGTDPVDPRSDGCIGQP